MISELQAAVRWLAEGAGYEIRKRGTKWTVAFDEGHTFQWLPGASGTLEGEVETVLGWLAKAGYNWSGWPIKDSELIEFRITRDSRRTITRESKSTLHAALASALVALYEGAEPPETDALSHNDEFDHKAQPIRHAGEIVCARCGNVVPAESEPPDA